ncbi:dienelactone hydrolase family protein [Gordonia shandongensis]|uniref:dienelactone hydrolase family protein n=1 Tax=Gordonia shandongensis TaxID=376351 RepID=UPI0003FF161E|nr:dienelactone hydrolase family protein [Gordonia shandongensis]
MTPAHTDDTGITVTKTVVNSGNDTFEALVAVPSGIDGPRPGVLVIHDITGSEVDIERNLRIIADRGYVAFAPLLFTVGARRPAACVVSALTSLATRRGRAFEVIEQARATLADLPECTGRVAVTGFCMGGGFALLVADRTYAAAAPFYGSVLTHGFAGPDMCPVVASFGARDPILPRGEKRLTKALDRHGVEHDTKTYPGVGHSFANQMDDRIPPALLRVMGFAYDDAASTDAWDRVFAFFDLQFGRDEERR